MPATSEAIDTMKPQGRSRKTNGSTAFLGKVDGRTAAARRYRDLVRAYTDELGGNLSALQGIRVDHAAALTVRLEQLHTAIAAGGQDVSDEDLVRVSNALRRELSALGLVEQEGEPPKPNLKSYLEGRTA